MRLLALALTISSLALADFTFDYEITTANKERQRYQIPPLARDFGLVLPTSSFKCMIRSDVTPVGGTDSAWADLWCCAEPASVDRCVVTRISCNPGSDGSGNLTLIDFPPPKMESDKKEDAKVAKSKDEKSKETKDAKETKESKEAKEKEAKDREVAQALLDTKKTVITFYCMHDGEVPSNLVRPSNP